VTQQRHQCLQAHPSIGELGGPGVAELVRCHYQGGPLGAAESRVGAGDDETVADRGGPSRRPCWVSKKSVSMPVRGWGSARDCPRCCVHWSRAARAIASSGTIRSVASLQRGTFNQEPVGP
jgi:hypothetical protein